MMKRETVISTIQNDRLLRGLAVTSFCAVVAVGLTASPVSIGEHGFSLNTAIAAGKSGDAGGGHGKDSAPGQIKQADNGDAASADEAIATVTGETGTDGGSDLDQVTPLPIDEEEPATNKVIKELAGLPEESELSEEEELEAIQSGWGTWRTADGPDTIIAQ